MGKDSRPNRTPARRKLLVVAAGLATVTYAGCKDKPADYPVANLMVPVEELTPSGAEPDPTTAPGKTPA
jgi:hypothetical protein